MALPVKQSALHPHRLSAARIAQMEKWRLLGAQARRGQHTAKRETFHAKRAKKGTPSVAKSWGRAAAWGAQKLVLPLGAGGPLVALGKNRLPGYNQVQIAKASTHRVSRGKHTGKLG
jgi:hypothetical protein